MRTGRFCGFPVRPGRIASGSATFFSKTPVHTTHGSSTGSRHATRILAYAVELTGRERGKIRGNLYELDYAAHFRHIREQALPADTVTLFYERGERSQPTRQIL